MHTADRKNPEVTTAIILEKRFPNKADKYPVKLRVTYQRKRKYYAIKGEHYTEKEFEIIRNPENRGKKKEKRKKFEGIEDRAVNVIDNVLNDFTFDAFEREYLTHKKQETSVQSYFEAKATELDENNKIQTATLYRATLKSLKEFDSKITFDKITPAYLKKYEKWMLEKGKLNRGNSNKSKLNKGNSYTSVGIYMRNLKHIVNRARKNRLIVDYPFGKKEDGKYQIPDSKNTKKALTINDIEKLFNYQTEIKNEYLALQYWIFSYLCNGMNMVDIANLKYSNMDDNYIKFYRQKTIDTTKEKKPIRVLLVPESLAIIKGIGNKETEPENYIFPIFKNDFSEIEKHNRLKQHIKQTNKYMRRIAAEIGIDEKITTYYARHSYSTILKRSGAPIEFISEQLGHQNTKVTQNYLDSFEDEQIAKYSANLTGFKNSKKSEKQKSD
jgi:integrase